MVQSSIGMLGGSFDPVHCAHIRLAQAARESLSLDHVLLMPAGRPPHKSGRRAASSRRRLDMLELAIEGIQGLCVSTLEIERPGPSFTSDTLKALRAQWGDQTRLYLIVGADMLCDLPHWHQVDIIADLAVVACAWRPPTDRDELERAADALHTRFGLRVQWIPFEATDISSSRIRARIAEGLSIEGLVPEGVRRYILKNGLYSGEGRDDNR